MLDYTPPLDDTIILEEYSLDSRDQAFLLRHPPREQQTEGPIQYLFSVEVVSEPNDPVLYVTSEFNRFPSKTLGTHFLGVFSDLGHENHGSSDDWGIKDLFLKKALSIICERLKINPSDVQRLPRQ